MAYSLAHPQNMTTSSGPSGGARRRPLLDTPTNIRPQPYFQQPQRLPNQRPQDRRQTEQRTPIHRPNDNTKRHKLQLKLLDTNERLPDRHKVFDITCNKLNAPLTNLYQHPNGYQAATDRDDTIEKLLTKKAIDEFRKINLTPVLPPDVRAKRTIFARRLDPYVTQHDNNAIKKELTERNDDLHIRDVFKISKSVIKITCDDIQTAQRLTTNGFKAFNTRTPPQQCEEEAFTPLLTCFKCYATEDHQTKDCKQDYDICSECGQTGHTDNARQRTRHV